MDGFSFEAAVREENNVLAIGLIYKTTDEMILDGRAVPRFRKAVSLTSEDAVEDLVQAIAKRLSVFVERHPRFTWKQQKRFLDSIFTKDRRTWRGMKEELAEIWRYVERGIEQIANNPTPSPARDFARRFCHPVVRVEQKRFGVCTFTGPENKTIQ